MANKKKLLTSVAAVGTAAAILLGGTFAWQSINQTALNEASDVINPGGRLHDDFNGSNKDIYVENFADEPIFARIRLEEYFEIIANYGAGEGIATSTKLLGGEETDNEGNTTHTYTLFNNYASLSEGTLQAGVKANTAYNADAEEGADGYAYWSWKTGGQTTYMPTFNMNKDSLKADINGIYEEGNVGTISNRDGTQYTEYVDYTDPANGSKTAMEIYDADANNLDDENVTEVEATHEAKATLDATLISMADWLGMVDVAGGYNAADHGNYWVYDTDGWVYWSAPIASGEATGLLLDGIELNQVMDDTWYYAINVVAQFVTADDVGKTDGTGFYDTTGGTAPSTEAESLLDYIGVDMDGEAGSNEPEEVVEYKIGVTAQESDYVSSFDGYLQPGGTYDFSVTYGGEPVEGVTYEMKRVETGNSLDLGAITDATTFVDGVLTIDTNETTRNGYNSYFKIVEITAKDADGEVITTRRLPITASGIRLEDLVFVDEDGNSTEIGVYTAALQVGKTYTWEVAIRDASTNVYLNEWLTLEDIGARVILDGSESYTIGTFSYDEDYNEIVTPNAAATFSADYSTITANELWPDDESLCVYILGPEVSEEYEGEIYTDNTFRIVQHIKIVEEWNIDVKVDWSPEEAAVVSSDGETTAALELYHVGIPAEDVVWKSTSDNITVTEDGEVSFTGTMTNDLEAYTVQACNSAGDVLTETTIYVVNSEKYEFIGTSRSWNTKYIALEYLPYTPEGDEYGYVDSQVCIYRAGDDLSQIYYYCDDYNPYVSDWADKFDTAYADGNMPLASDVTWGSHVTTTE